MRDKYNKLKQNWEYNSILTEIANDWKQSYGCYPTINEFINLVNKHTSISLNNLNTLTENRLVTSNDITWLSKKIINEQAEWSGNSSSGDAFYTNASPQDIENVIKGAPGMEPEIRRRYARAQAAKVDNAAPAGKPRNAERQAAEAAATAEKMKNAQSEAAANSGAQQEASRQERIRAKTARSSNPAAGTTPLEKTKTTGTTPWEKAKTTGRVLGNIGGGLLLAAPMVGGMIGGGVVGNLIGGTGSPEEFGGEVLGGVVADRIAHGAYKGVGYVGEKTGAGIKNFGSLAKRRMPIAGYVGEKTGAGIKNTGSYLKNQKPSSVGQVAGMVFGERVADRGIDWWKSTDTGKEFAEKFPKTEYAGELIARGTGMVGGSLVPAVVSKGVKLVPGFRGPKLPGLIGVGAALVGGLATGAKADDIVSSLNPLEILGGSSISSAGEGPDYDSVGNFIGPDYTETEEEKLKTKKKKDEKEQWEKEHPTQNPIIKSNWKYDPNDQSGDRAPQQMRGQLKEFINKHVQHALLKEYKSVPYLENIEKGYIEPFVRSFAEPMVKVIKPVVELTKKEMSGWFAKEAPKVLEKEAAKIPFEIPSYTNHPIIRLPTASPPIITTTNTSISTGIQTGSTTFQIPKINTSIKNIVRDTINNIVNPLTHPIEVYKNPHSPVDFAPHNNLVINTSLATKTSTDLATKTGTGLAVPITKAVPTLPITKIDPVTDTKTDPVTDTKTDPVTDTKTDPVTNTKTDPVTDTKTDPVTNTKPRDKKTKPKETKPKETKPKRFIPLPLGGVSTTDIPGEGIVTRDDNAANERYSALYSAGERNIDPNTGQISRGGYSRIVQVQESKSGTLNSKSAIQKRSKKQQYKISINDGGKKLDIFASSIQGIKRAVFGKTNFKIHDSRGSDITGYFKRLLASKKSA
jgi:hypothetical protein